MVTRFLFDLLSLCNSFVVGYRSVTLVVKEGLRGKAPRYSVALLLTNPSAVVGGIALPVISGRGATVMVASLSLF